MSHVDYTRETTIDQHRGDHASGTPITEYVTITTTGSGLGCPVSEDGEHDGAVIELVDAVHEARVRLASLRAEERAAVQMLLDGSDCEPDSEAATIHDAIRRATGRIPGQGA